MSNYEQNFKISPQARKLHNKYATQLDSNYSKQDPKKSSIVQMNMPQYEVQASQNE